MLRRILPVILAALLAVGILAGASVAYAEGDPTGHDTLKADPTAAVNFT